MFGPWFFATAKFCLRPWHHNFKLSFWSFSFCSTVIFAIMHCPILPQICPTFFDDSFLKILACSKAPAHPLPPTKSLALLVQKMAGQSNVCSDYTTSSLWIVRWPKKLKKINLNKFKKKLFKNWKFSSSDYTTSSLRVVLYHGKFDLGFSIELARPPDMNWICQFFAEVNWK